MVERHLLGAPFSLPLLLLSWLPSNHTTTRQNGACRRPWWDTVVDDPALLKEIKKYKNFWKKKRFKQALLISKGFGKKEHPTGTNALPYLVYLLTMYPVLMLLVWVTYFAMAPYRIIYFTFWGHQKWIRASVSQNTNVRACRAAFGGRGGRCMLFMVHVTGGGGAGIQGITPSMRVLLVYYYPVALFVGAV
ncbi:hypothetical protein Agub_g5610 [Astrephomene gubernaculifera]|uniref:Uncharacterized protein n=1 Tax=Astrephomene gubernaculifera TaxID=47775 RepID=A0AAD3HL62_9CHLO|nr:hypothetical protein Agub_g5610 [Astrephomene gubernaculifera]